MMALNEQEHLQQFISKPSINAFKNTYYDIEVNI